MAKPKFEFNNTIDKSIRKSHPTACDGMLLLIQNGFIATGNVLNFKTGKTRELPILRHSKNGGYNCDSHWAFYQHCPACGGTKCVDSLQPVTEAHLATQQNGKAQRKAGARE